MLYAAERRATPWGWLVGWGGGGWPREYNQKIHSQYGTGKMEPFGKNAGERKNCILLHKGGGGAGGGWGGGGGGGVGGGGGGGFDLCGGGFFWGGGGGGGGGGVWGGGGTGGQEGVQKNRGGFFPEKSCHRSTPRLRQHRKKSFIHTSGKGGEKSKATGSVQSKLQ